MHVINVPEPWPLFLLGFISSLPQLAWEKGYVVVVAVVVVVVDYACLLNLNGDSVRVWYGSKLD